MDWTAELIKEQAGSVLGIELADEEVHSILSNNNASLKSAMVLQKLYVPALRSRGLDDCASRLNAFVSRVLELSDLEAEQTLPPLPDIDLPDLPHTDAVVVDPVTVQLLESWADELNEVITKEMRAAAKETFHDWHRRRLMLSRICKAIDADPILSARKVLECHNSSTLSKLAGDVAQQNDEAIDNYKFLGAITDCLDLISSQESFEVLLDVLPKTLATIRAISSASRYFNREGDIFPLLLSISNALSRRVRDSVNLDTVFNEPASSIILLTDSKELLDSWCTAYQNLRTSLTENERRWDFDRSALFGLTDYISSVCSDLLKAVQISSEFHNNLGHDLASISEYTVGDLARKMSDITSPILSIAFDLFEMENKDKWKGVDEQFHELVASTESYGRACISRSFQNLKSADEAFLFLIKYDNELKRFGFDNGMASDELSDYVLDRFLVELDALSKSFQKGKEQPHIMEPYLPGSGRVAWADSLFAKAKAPMARFHEYPELLSTEVGKDVLSRYESFSKVIETYKHDIFRTWQSRATRELSESLRKFIITKTPKQICDVSRYDSKRTRAENVSHQSAVSLLSANCPKELPTLLREAGHFQTIFGFTLPESFDAIIPQEGYYHELMASVQDLTSSYNCLITSMTEIESGILSEQVQKLSRSFELGSTKLNWMSTRVSTFVNARNDEISEITKLLNVIRKHSSSLKSVVGRMSQFITIYQVEVKPSVTKLCSEIESQVEKRIPALLQMYQSLPPFLLEIEMAISGTREGELDLLNGCYFHWQKEVCNSLAQVLVRSLVALKELISTSTADHSQDLTGKDDVSSATLQDVYRRLSRCIRHIIYIPKRFPRWFAGTCVEVFLTEEDADDVMLLSGNYLPNNLTFYQELASNEHLVECVTSIHNYIQEFLGPRVH